jgi:hypothetical protein
VRGVPHVDGVGPGRRRAAHRSAAVHAQRVRRVAPGQDHGPVHGEPLPGGRGARLLLDKVALLRRAGGGGHVRVADAVLRELPCEPRAALSARGKYLIISSLMHLAIQNST